MAALHRPNYKTTNVVSAFYNYTVHRQQNVHYGTVAKVCPVLSSKAQISVSHSDSVMFCQSRCMTLTLSISVELHSLLTCHSVCPGLLWDVQQSLSISPTLYKCPAAAAKKKFILLPFQFPSNIVMASLVCGVHSALPSRSAETEWGAIVWDIGHNSIPTWSFQLSSFTSSFPPSLLCTITLFSFLTLISYFHPLFLRNSLRLPNHPFPPPIYLYCLVSTLPASSAG